MAFVLDASVSLAWLFEDEVSPYADQILARLGNEEALVPALWPLEMANGLLTAERRGRLSTADVIQGGALLLDLPISVAASAADGALGPVLDLARSQGLSAYDAAYLDLAMREGIPLATQDDGLSAAAGRVGVPIAA